MGRRRTNNDMNAFMRGRDTQKGARDTADRGEDRPDVEALETPELVEMVGERRDAYEEVVAELIRRSGAKDDTADTEAQTKPTPDRG